MELLEGSRDQPPTANLMPRGALTQSDPRTKCYANETELHLSAHGQFEINETFVAATLLDTSAPHNVESETALPKSGRLDTLARMWTVRGGSRLVNHREPRQCVDKRSLICFPFPLRNFLATLRRVW
ncbi:hypothetical protein ACJJTC_001174 [Scirpophaga incertulas]